MQIFNFIISKGITPNQCYVLDSIKKKVVPVNVNIHQDLRVLVADGWLTPVGHTYKLELKAEELLTDVEDMLRVSKKKNSTAVMGDNYKENVLKYIELFPKIIIPTSKLPARSAPKNVETVFKWFFENYSYTWETIFKATSFYVDEYERKNYHYMRTSQYFIMKQEVDKTVLSKLADYCAIVASGTNLSQNKGFSEKVV